MHPNSKIDYTQPLVPNDDEHFDGEHFDGELLDGDLSISGEDSDSDDVLNGS